MLSQPAEPVGANPLSTAGLEVFHFHPGCCVLANLDNVALQIWRRNPDPDDALKLIHFGDALAEKYPGGISTIHWVQATFGVPSQGVREHLGTLMQRRGPWYGEAAIIFRGDGFLAGALRSMLTGLSIATRGRAGYSMNESVDEAIGKVMACHRARTGIDMSHLRTQAALFELDQTFI